MDGVYISLLHDVRKVLIHTKTLFFDFQVIPEVTSMILGLHTIDIDRPLQCCQLVSKLGRKQAGERMVSLILLDNDCLLLLGYLARLVGDQVSFIRI
jgi:hypothetical protein